MVDGNFQEDFSTFPTGEVPASSLSEWPDLLFRTMGPRIGIGQDRSPSMWDRKGATASSTPTHGADSGLPYNLTAFSFTYASIFSPVL
jgi:hypothetical protein